MSQALTLYQIEEHLAAMLDSVELVEGVEQEKQFLMDLAEAGQQVVAKRDNVIRFLRHLSTQQEACQAEMDRLALLKAHYARTQKRLEDYVIGIIQELVPAPKRGAKRLEGSIGVMVLRKNPDSVEIGDEAAVPEEYKVLTITLPAAKWGALVKEFADILEAYLGPLGQLKADCRVEKRPIKEALDAKKEVPGASLRTGAHRLEVK